MGFRSEGVQNEHAHLDARNICLDRREDRVDRNLGCEASLVSQHASKSPVRGVERAMLRWSDGNADGIESVIASRGLPTGKRCRRAAED